MDDRAQALALVDELKAGVEAIESVMPIWEPGAADVLNQLERKTEVLGRLSKCLEDGAALSDVTVTAATARRAVAALYSLVKGIAGMGYVGACGILAEMVGEANVNASADIGKVQDFLEDVIEQVLDDAWDSLEVAVDRETAIAGMEQDPDVVNAEGFVHLSNASGVSHRYVSVENLEDVSAFGWCNEFAIDAADVIKGAIGALDDPEEAREWLGDIDRSVFGNDVLLRSVVRVILGNVDHCVYDDCYEAALGHAQELLETTVLKDSKVEVAVGMEALEEAYSELVPVRKVGTSGIGAGGKRPRSISQEAVRRTKNSSRPLRASTDRSLPRSRGSVAAAGPPVASRRARSGAGCCNRSGAMADSGVRPAWDAGEPGASGCGRTPPIGRGP